MKPASNAPLVTVAPGRHACMMWEYMRRKTRPSWRHDKTQFRSGCVPRCVCVCVCVCVFVSISFANELLAQSGPLLSTLCVLSLANSFLMPVSRRRLGPIILLRNTLFSEVPFCRVARVVITHRWCSSMCSSIHVHNRWGDICHALFPIPHGPNTLRHSRNEVTASMCGNMCSDAGV
jgi:hypothetical protein